MRFSLRLLFPFAMVLAFWYSQVEAFASSSLIHTCRASLSSQCSSTALGEGNDLFDKFKSFWNGIGDSGKNDQNEAIENEDAAAGTSRIVTIPVKAIKPGGLRLFLMFYCMGMQNTPDRMSWRADQPSMEEYIVDMFFHDGTGILTVELLEDEIRIGRTGSRPSTSYLMQESVVVQGMLDELQQCASDESVVEENRLLIPEPADAIESAREALAFG